MEEADEDTALLGGVLINAGLAIANPKEINKRRDPNNFIGGKCYCFWPR